MSDVLHRFVCLSCSREPFYAFEDACRCVCGSEAKRDDICVTAATTNMYEGVVHDTLNTIDDDVDQETERELVSRDLVKAEKLRRGIDVEPTHTAS